ncbi:MAG: GntR family transcriptional activator of glc operon [Kiritimatiellia bacterium]
MLAIDGIDLIAGITRLWQYIKTLIYQAKYKVGLVSMDDIVETHSMRISRHLEELILDGTLQPGDKVPSERQLAQRLKASRPLIREALKELRGRGVIETRHGKGSFIIGMLNDVQNETPLARLYDSHPRLLYDLLEVRELLESEAACLAAERGTEKDFYKITKAYNAMSAPPEAFNEVATSDIGKSRLYMAQLDHAFHRAIYEASHNPVLVHTLQSLMQLMLNSVMASVSNLYHRDRQKQQIDKHHRQIYNAIIDRKPETAKRVAAEHIRNVRERMLEIEREEQRLERAKIWAQEE